MREAAVPLLDCRRRSRPIESLLHQSRQIELPVGSGEWLLAVVGAVAVHAPQLPAARLSMRERRAQLEERLHASGLAYGTGAVDPAVELDPEATPGARAFANFVAGLVRLCARAATLADAPWFVTGPERIPTARASAVQARRAQLVAVLAAAAGEARAGAELFAAPLDDSARLSRLAARIAARLSRRYLAQAGPFAGLPLHNGLCAIEVRTCATLALSAFEHERISPGAAALTQHSALAWRALLVELLAGLAQAQENGEASRRGIDQTLRSQRLPAKEARLLRRALSHPRTPEELGPALHSSALREFALEQVLLASLVDRHFDAGEVAFVERLARATGASAEHVAGLEVRVDEFYRRNKDALLALRLAEEPEGFPHALTTRLEEAVRDNLDRILQEIRKTGELAELLARAGVGVALTSEEKARVRSQLIDLAKTIPALAIFAAPGGMLLLPILLKLLPFNLLPSSFVDAPPPPPALPKRRRSAGS